MSLITTKKYILQRGRILSCRGSRRPRDAERETKKVEAIRVSTFFVSVRREEAAERVARRTRVLERRGNGQEMKKVGRREGAVPEKSVTFVVLPGC